MKASKNHNNVIGEERLAHIKSIVISLGGKLTYVFFMQLHNCFNKDMLWFLVCYFVVDDLILLFMALIELLGLWISSSVVYKDFGICA
jgi:hypothetical protein